MNQLKFSHNYLKLPPNWEHKKATLLFVREIELEKLTQAFLDYDTAYYDETEYHNLCHYPLPKKGKYLLLLFETVEPQGSTYHQDDKRLVGCEGTIFTTLRRYTLAKEVYYRGETRKEFELITW